MIDFLPNISCNNIEITDSNEELSIQNIYKIARKTQSNEDKMLKTQTLMKSSQVRNQNQRKY